MIESLTISNLGIITAASIELDPGLTVLTGETGAGKSMILQSIGLLMGDRASAELVLDSADRARVDCELTFNQNIGTRIVSLVEESGGECEEIENSGDRSLLISREISHNGRGKIFLGGRQVPASALRQVSENLIALHGQSDQVLLRDGMKQLELLDRAGGEATTNAKTTYQIALRQYRRLLKEQATLRSSEVDQQARIFVLQQGINEISELNLIEGEDDQAAQKISVMRNIDDLNGCVETARDLLSGALDSGPESRSTSVVEQLSEIAKSLEHGRELDGQLAEYLDRVVSTLTELSDVDADLGIYLAGLGADPDELAALEARVSQLSIIKKKYGPSLPEVIAWREHAENELSMPFAQVKIELEVEQDPQLWTRSGCDRVVFMLAAHESAKFLPLARCASGGELSRVMLAIEVALAGEDPVPTMIFDEVDAGIGGTVAVEVGRRLAKLALHTQVIVVTHLPQVAAFADRHLVVEKKAAANSVQTTVSLVHGDARVREITRMLSGLLDSEHGGAHAMELLELGAKK
jgi:DNA repair protein RecN (Recombination protein N)